MQTAVIHRQPTALSIFLGIFLILAGILAIAVPLLAGLAASVFFGWLIMFAGVAHLVYAWSERGAGSIILQIFIGIIYTIAAFYLLSQPVSGILSLTLIFAFYIAVEGIVELVIFARWRHLPGAPWFLFDGLVSLLVAGLIFFHWPSNSIWAVGTLVGVSLIASGVARLTMPTLRRRLVTI